MWFFGSSCCLCFAFFFQGISATSEDIPNKIEDLRSECSSDFGGKDSVTSPDMDEVTHGKKGKWGDFLSSHIHGDTGHLTHCWW